MEEGPKKGRWRRAALPRPRRRRREEADETDSVFLAAWTSARIPPPGFSDDSFLGGEVGVHSVRFSVAVQETRGPGQNLESTK